MFVIGVYGICSLQMIENCLHFQVDLINSIGLSSDLGVEGLVLWGDHLSEDSPSICNDVKHYVDSELGPFTESILNFTRMCSVELCHGNGRCVAHISKPVCTYSRNASQITSRRQLSHLIDSREDNAAPVSIYHCVCCKGYVGEHCDGNM